MKEQFTCVLPPLPIVGNLQLLSRDGKTISRIEVVKKNIKVSQLPSGLFLKAYESFGSYLSGESTQINLPLDFSHLSPFQLKVLEAIGRIPYGKVATYKDLAQTLNSRAYQAIGSACGRNPFLVIFPCHRVVGTQDLGGFAHGLLMKKELLRLEGYES